jgi:NADPH2:quinone reductase
MSGLQQYALLSANAAAKVPEGFTPDDMVTFPVNATTSFAALFDAKCFGFPAPAPFPQSSSTSNFNAKEKTILVIGGGSAVGKLAIQYAKIAGIGSVITTASPSRTEELKSLGATHVISRYLSASEIEAEVKGITGQEGLEYIYDCVSWDYGMAIGLLREKGKSVLLTLHPAEEAIEKAKERRPEARVVFVLGNSDFIQPNTGRFWEALPAWVKGGHLKVGKYMVVEGLDLERIQEGLKSYRDGSAVEPVVVHPNSQ